MKLIRHYIRYFVIGYIFAALVLGSMTIKATRPDAPPEKLQCEPFGTGRCEPSEIERCQPYYHPILPECPNNFGFYPKETPVCPKQVDPCPQQDG